MKTNEQTRMRERLADQAPVHGEPAKTGSRCCTSQGGDGSVWCHAIDTGAEPTNNPPLQNEEIRSMAPLVFLDFDDVICVNAPYGGYDLFAPDPPNDLWALLFHAPAVETLKVIVEEFDPRFIITTSWLRLMERDGFESLFLRCGLQFVGNRMHDAWEAPPQTPRMTRLQSIEHWLARNHRGQPFVVLDDLISGTGLGGSRLHTQGRVVMCKADEGLRSKHLPQIRRALRKQA